MNVHQIIYEELLELLCGRRGFGHHLVIEGIEARIWWTDKVDEDGFIRDQDRLLSVYVDHALLSWSPFGSALRTMVFHYNDPDFPNNLMEFVGCRTSVLSVVRSLLRI